MQRRPFRLVPMCVAVILTTSLVIVLQSGAAGDAFSRDLSQSGDPTQLRLNEFMAINNGTLIDPADNKDDEDWLEVYNPTDQFIDLQGLYITDSRAELTKHAITRSLVISPFSFLILFADRQTEQGPDHLSFRLSGGGEAVGLVAADGLTEIDFFIFDAQERNVSMGRLPDGTGSWQKLSVATPGDTNAFVPVISNVQNTPAIPRNDQNVQVTATVTDNLGVTAVELFYHVINATTMQTVTSSSVAMDPLGDNRYQAQIGARPDNTLVSYYIIADDMEGQSSRSPKRLDRNHNYLVGYVPPPLVINEIMADNEATLIDPDEPPTATIGNLYPDWFEVYNLGPTAIDLEGYFFSDDPANPSKNKVTGTLIIPAGDFIVLYADEDRVQGVRHLNFRLSSGGESLGIYGGPFAAAPIDVLSFGPMRIDQSYGRFPDGDGNFTFELCSTPEEANILCDQKSYLPLLQASRLIQSANSARKELTHDYP